MTEEHAHHRPEDDAARLGLVVVGEPPHCTRETTHHSTRSENIRDTVDDLVDEP